MVSGVVRVAILYFGIGGDVGFVVFVGAGAGGASALSLEEVVLVLVCWWWCRWCWVLLL